MICCAMFVLGVEERSAREYIIFKTRKCTHFPTNNDNRPPPESLVATDQIDLRKNLGVIHINSQAHEVYHRSIKQT